MPDKLRRDSEMQCGKGETERKRGNDMKENGMEERGKDWGTKGKADGEGQVMEQREQAVDVDVQMASETCSICPKPTSSHLHLPGAAEAEHNAGRVRWWH